MYQHRTLYADTFPSVRQLDEMSKEGWEMFLLIPDEDRFIIYLRQLKPI